MVFILVVLTVVVFLLAEWYLVHRRRTAREASWAVQRTTPELETYFHPGHAWARVTPDGLMAAGATDLAANFAGDLLTVELPRKGEHLRQGELACTLVSRRGRRLDLAMPVSGVVLAANRRLLQDPGLARRDPYGEGWILRARSRRPKKGLANLLHGQAARKWLEACREAVTARIDPVLGGLALDGGEWTPSFGDLLNDDDWMTLKKDLFPAGRIPDHDKTD